MNHVWRWILEYIYMQYMHTFYVKVKVLVTQLCLTLFNPWTVAHQALLSMEYSRQEYWSGLPSRSPGDLPNPWIEPSSPSVGRFFTIWAISVYICLNNESSIYVNTLRSSFIGLRTDINQLEIKESWESQEPIFHQDKKKYVQITNIPMKTISIISHQGVPMKTVVWFNVKTTRMD